jgi:6-pyruvoyltetrahydropterin/6-carboxytetrahydropterin synthase
MLELSRTIRLCLNADCPSPTSGFGWYSELVVRCRGEADPVTGYLMNISEIDQATRETAVPLIEKALRENPRCDAAEILANIIPALMPQLRNALDAVTWRLTPYYSLHMQADALDRILITQRFEFSASHRLHAPALSDEKNRTIFGKCNNPNSHGHNYWIQPQVSAPLNAANGARFTAAHMERIVEQVILQRFDHKHLNQDTREFAELNPSVENIAKVCYELLRQPVQEAGGRLERVTIWETEKTSCTYPA